MTSLANNPLTRRRLLQGLGIGAAAGALPGCSDTPEPGRYTAGDIERLRRQREAEAAASGNGPYGPLRFPGYRGLAELPWFELDAAGELRCVDDSFAPAIDIHAHLGMSVLFAPAIDLQARTPRVRHLLDCDATDPGCELDLDVYINSNFTPEALDALQQSTLAQALWGSAFAETHTIPNLLHEMDSMRIEQCVILPIKLGLPFGDRQSVLWRSEIAAAGAQGRLPCGLSVHPRGAGRIERMRELAAGGARIMKLHPTVQSFYPDDADMMPVYEEAQRLGIAVFFHGGRAGIEPESRHRYALPRHYEAVLADFPRLQVVLGHAGARDGEAMLELALRYDNAWLDIHGQGVSRLEAIIRRTEGERLLFGTDWPFYHLGASLAKVLLCTRDPGRRAMRDAILRGNALALLPELDRGAA